MLNRMQLPTLRLAVFRDDYESLANPGWDVAVALGAERRWQTDLFDDRSLGGLLDAEARYDVIVIAHNALRRSPRLAKAITEIEWHAGLLILHQLDVPGDRIDLGGLTFSTTRLVGPPTIRRVAGRAPESEVLLQWPRAIDAALLTASAVRGLEISSNEPWRPVLEDRSRPDPVPLLLRSPASHPNRIVVTTLLLEPERDAHRHLLDNMVVYCGVGLPDTVVFHEDPEWRDNISRDLTLRGVRAVSVAPNGRSCDDWPLRVAANIVVEDGPPEPGNLNAWLEGGGRLAVVKPDGELEVRSLAGDSAWLARMLGAWLQSESGRRRWEESTVVCRRVTLLLRRLEAQGVSLGRFGLPSPESRNAEVTRLLRTRLGDRDNLEETVSATVAAYELLLSLPDSLRAGQHERVRSWLEKEFPDAVVEDQLEIARVMKRNDLLALAGTRLGSLPATVAKLVRARYACVACSAVVPAAVWQADISRYLKELSDSPSTAAEYLSSAAQWSRARSEPLGEPELVEVAIATLRRGGVSADHANEVPAELLLAAWSARFEFALLSEARLSGLDPTRQVPETLVDDVLRESARLRAENHKLAREVEINRRATHALGTVPLAIVVAGVILASGSISSIGDVASTALFALVALVALYALLERLSLLTWPRLILYPARRLLALLTGASNDDDAADHRRDEPVQPGSGESSR
jgi:hypothetical protein